MDVLGYIERLFGQYGYWVLLLGLPLDAIALPIPPGNTTLTYTGYLSYKGVLDLLPALGAAYLGSIVGLTVTYVLGYKLGQPLIERYGKWLFLKPEHVEKTARVYHKYGNKLLLFSYFIPGVRQFIGYFTGIIRIPYRTFALYAYTGSALWVTVFIGIGYIFGNQWQLVLTWTEHFLKYVVAAVFAILAVYVYLKWRKRTKVHSRQ
ncbi:MULTISPECIES: DedA family protein [Paenibacillus]|uniref:DedA family protein n=1 Tax=Paenibacillus TaxID=44249 RepID=UPI000CF97938|nr:MULTISPECIES: DedA family protein [Paenibacillus]MBJ9987147.1 DedA family protein [Paenibacillus sp. S28]PQP89264.1 alkaline phosphatase [Paenibacillus sp. AR247]